MDEKNNSLEFISKEEFDNRMDLVGQAIQELNLLIQNQHLPEGADHIENLHRLIPAIRFGLPL